MNGDEVRNVKFGRGIYEASQVDDLLGRIAGELDAGRPAGPLIANAEFRLQFNLLRPGGYDTATVDWFLERLRLQDRAEPARMNADPWRDLAAEEYHLHRDPGGSAWRIIPPSKQECEDAWRAFGQQPGTYLSWVRKGALRRELRTEEQWPAAWKVTSATFRKLGSPTFTAGGRTFTTRRVTSSTWPGIAEAISRDRIGPVAHRPQNERDPLVHTELADETGIPILYAGGSSNSGSAFIKFPGQRWLRFPVRSTRQEDAIMTAVDEAGNKVARYRLVLNGASYWTTPEITVHPDQQLTDELVLAIAVSAPWLRAYFRNAADGG